jgi:DNA-directed RNA polymerase specialized sigma24 family protein
LELSVDPPISEWLVAAKSGDDQAIASLWKTYFQKVINLARGRMIQMSRSVYDEEDAALSAMHSLFRGAEQGAFPELNDRDNLWKLLVVITARKVNRRIEYSTANKRGGGDMGSCREVPDDIQTIVDREPTADFVAEMMEDLQSRLDQLPDKSLQRVAMLTMEGHTQQQIAETLHCTERTIRRKLETIRAIWQESN